MTKISYSIEGSLDGALEVTHYKDPQGEWRPWHSGELYYIKDVDLKTIAYIWDPFPTKKASNLENLTDITTYHHFNYCWLFKPSVAEVLAQIPEEYLAETVAFEIIESPETADDFKKHLEAFNAGYHTAVTRLYKKAT